MSEVEPEALLSQIRAQYAKLKKGSWQMESFLLHVRSLRQWYEWPMDYREVDAVDFPKTMPIAYAVCHPDCGTEQFIVDGSTQECQRCGRPMFRTLVQEYMRT